MNNIQDRELIKRLDLCYQKLSGKPLPSPSTIADRYRWLHEEAPYSILAHNTEADPCFIYANQCALRCFNYTQEELLGLPSRLSAVGADQQERQQMLDSLKAKDIVYNYSGMRITSKGDLFKIYDGVIWQLKDDSGVLWGQGALFWPVPGASSQEWAICSSSSY